jgi:hypothetical protein
MLCYYSKSCFWNIITRHFCIADGHSSILKDIIRILSTWQKKIHIKLGSTHTDDRKNRNNKLMNVNWK